RDLGVSLRVGRSQEERAWLWAIRHSASPVVAAQASRGLVSMQFVEDSVVRDGRLPSYLSGIEEILKEEQTDAVVFGHAGDGNVHVNPLVDVTRHDWRDTVRRILHGTVELVADLGGTLSGEHGDGRLRGAFHPRIFGEPVADAFRRVKSTLDPAGILNPGVIVPLPGQDPLDGITPLRRAP
ncbi:MAG TPA: FAD-linked oxidase C-terminal domain-containing protein, partial [Longimicrobiales bacterium]|nr:FAD-linked oxidase C-terminal domain-containing protein [Longimicrobiales bacterium]